MKLLDLKIPLLPVRFYVGTDGYKRDLVILKAQIEIGDA